MGLNYIEYKVRVYDYGTKEWLLHGKRHREDGPAVESSFGGKFWYLNGNYHREDGPAAEHADGYKAWYLKGVNYTEADYKVEMERRTNTCDGKIVTIEGKEYTLTEVSYERRNTWEPRR